MVVILLYIRGLWGEDYAFRLMGFHFHYERP